MEHLMAFVDMQSISSFSLTKIVSCEGSG